MLQFNARRLPVELRVQIVITDTAEDSLGVQNFQNSPFSEAVGGLGSREGGFRFLQAAVFVGPNLLAGDLIFAISAFELGGQLQLEDTGRGVGLDDAGGGLSNLPLPLVHKRERDGNADPPVVVVRLPLILA